jgi:hypothetical protein
MKMKNAVVLLAFCFAAAIVLAVRFWPARLSNDLAKWEAAIEATRAEAAREVEAYRPRHPVRLDDLSTSVVEILGGLPFVTEVKRSRKVAGPKARIIHLVDWHFVPADLHGIDIENAYGRPLSDAEKASLFEEHRRQVEIVQIEQVAVLRCLAKWHGLGTVFSEGFATGQEDAYQQRLTTLAGDDLLMFGVPARLLLAGDLKQVLPLEDEALLRVAKPVVDNAIRPDDAKIRARETAMVQAVLRRGHFGLVVLGGLHDLADLVPDDCEYIRVTVRSVAASR